jgi:Ribbon-helix-helix protein, copG family
MRMRAKNAKSPAVMKPKTGNQKPKLNITLHEDTKEKLAALARLEKRSVSNLIEIMADERWERLAEREGVDYAKTVAEIAGLKGLNADKEADRKVFRREILERVLKFKKR